MSALKNLTTTFLAVFILSLVSAQNDFDFLSESDWESMDEIQELLRNVQNLYKMKIASKFQQSAVQEEMDDEIDIQVFKSGCRCSDSSCSCCAHIDIKKLHFNHEFCLSATFKPDELKIQIILSLDSKILLAKTISASNTSPVCVPIPYTGGAVAICLKFYDLSTSGTSYNGCVKLKVKVAGFTVLSIKLGCLSMNIPFAKQLRATELPYFHFPQAPVEGPQSFYFGDAPMKKIKPRY